MDYEEAIELCDEILASLEDLPEQAEDFSDSVYEKVTSMRVWIEENERVTDKMISALENIQAGVSKWLR